MGLDKYRLTLKGYLLSAYGRGMEGATFNSDTLAGELFAKLAPVLEENEQLKKDDAKLCKELYEVVEKNETLLARIKELEGQVERIRENTLAEVETTLDLYDDEYGWVNISNHVSYSRWQSLKEGKE